MTNTTPSGSLGSGAPAGSLSPFPEIGGASEPTALVLINSVDWMSNVPWLLQRRVALKRQIIDASAALDIIERRLGELSTKVA